MPQSVIIAVIACVVIGALSVYTGVSHIVNGPWHDVLQRQLPRTQGPSPVVLIESDASVETQDLVAATRTLISAGARRIGVMTGPVKARRVSRVFDGSGQRLVVAWPARPSGDAEGRWEVPDTAPAGAPVFALAAGPGPPHRTQPIAISTAQGARPTIEAALAGTRSAERGIYHIDYRGDFARLPRLAFERVVSGDVLEQTVKDRTALITTSETWTAPLLDAPVAGPGLTGGQVHAFAVRTLLDGRPLTTLPVWVASGGLLILSMLAGGIAAFLSTRAQLPFALGLLALAVTVSVGAFAAFGRVVPGAELALALLAPPVAVFVHRERKEDRLLERLVASARARARERDQAARSNEDAWQLTARLVAENLNISRVVFLELPTDGTHVRPLAGVNADGSAIAERRRDIRRTPYTFAATPNTATELTSAYLIPAEDDSRQFLVPLSFGSRILGYWAFSTPADTDPAADGTLAAVPVFAERAAELLYLERSPARERRGLRGWFAGVGDKRLSAGLAESLRVTERQTELLEEVSAHLDTAIAVFDTYGRPIHVNRAMAELGQHEKCQPYRATATDLLVELGGFSRDRARALHRQAAMGAESVQVPLERDIAGKRYMLSVTGLKLSRIADDGAPVPDAGMTNVGVTSRTAGVLLAFSDYTSAAEMFQMTQALGYFVNTRLRNDLGSIRIASDLLLEPRERAQREHAAGLLNQAVRRAENELNALDQRYLQSGSDEQTEASPVDPMMILKRAVTAVQPAAAERGIAVRFDPPRLSGPALALPETLHGVLRAAATLVIDGADPGTEMAIHFSEDSWTTSIAFEASGFGMPEDRLQLLLARPERDEPDAARVLRSGRRDLHAWGGDLSAHAGLGEGIRITVKLPRALRVGETEETT